MYRYIPCCGLVFLYVYKNVEIEGFVKVFYYHSVSYKLKMSPILGSIYSMQQSCKVEITNILQTVIWINDCCVHLHAHIFVIERKNYVTSFRNIIRKYVMLRLRTACRCNDYYTWSPIRINAVSQMPKPIKNFHALQNFIRNTSNIYWNY